MIRTGAFEAFIAPARAYPSIWRIAVATLSGLAVYIVGATAILWFAIAPLSRVFPELEGLDHISLLYGNGTSPGQMAVILATFIPMGLAALVMAAWHWRGLASLLGPREDFARAFFVAMAVLLAIQIVYVGLERIIAPRALTPNLPLATWAGHLVWAVPLLFIQTTSEELVFRGYFQQQIAARFKHWFWWMVAPSLVFGLGHYNDTIEPVLALLIVFATTLFGVVAADLTRITGSLAAAMGLHFTNNFLALLIVGIPGELSGLALYHVDFTMNDTAVVQGYLLIDIAVLVVVWLAARRALR